MISAQSPLTKSLSRGKAVDRLKVVIKKLSNLYKADEGQITAQDQTLFAVEE